MEIDFKTLQRTSRRAFEKEPRRLDDPGLVRSAVLICVIDRKPSPTIVFTKRTMTVAKHKGQISFPGGAEEDVDDGPVDTALREAEEEISLQRDEVEVAAVLDDQITTTGFVITPVLGFAPSTVSFDLDPAEVDEVFEVPVATLMKPANHIMRVIEHKGVRFNDHRYFAGTNVIWGATGRILRTFLEKLRKAR